MRVLSLFLLLFTGLLVSGCSSRPETVSMPNLPQAMPVNPPDGSYMLTANTYAGDALHKMLLLRMGSEGGILTTSFVDMNNFEETSPFGRIAAQQVGSRIGQYGFRVLEPRLADTLVLERQNGEFMLTRDARRVLTAEYDANAVLVGCYSNAGGSVFVSARVVRLSDNAIMGAYEYYLPRDAEVGSLLAGTSSASRGDGVWERHSRREQAFAPGRAANAASGKAAVSNKQPAVKRVAATADVPTPQRDTAPAPSSATGATPVPPQAAKDTPALDVPRHVAPAVPSTPFSESRL